MNQTNARLLATLIISVTFGSIFITFFIVTDALQFGHFVLAFFLAVFMFTSYGVVWNWGELPKEEKAEISASKRKSGDKLNRIMSKLSDEELDSLRDRLIETESGYGLSDDGELTPLRRK